MYLMLKHIVPDDIMNIINDFCLDREEYKRTYHRVMRELLWIQIHKELKERLV